MVKLDQTCNGCDGTWGQASQWRRSSRDRSSSSPPHSPSGKGPLPDDDDDDGDDDGDDDDDNDDNNDDDDDDDDQLQVRELGDEVSADPGGVEEPFAVRLVHNLPL